MNKVLITGNVTSKYDNGTNVRITVADNYKNGTNYIPVTLFDQKADFAKKFINIGDHICIEGAIGCKQRQNEVGKQENSLFVQCWSISFEGYRNPNKDKNPSYSATEFVTYKSQMLPVNNSPVFEDNNGFVDISSVSALTEDEIADGIGQTFSP